jgi:riboflavin synthase
MFTGLIEATGRVRALERRGGATRITVEGPATLVERLRTGDSVAVSGVCLTALDLDPMRHTFDADLAAETIARTSLTRLQPGAVVNLELPTPAGSPLGGHVVQGHVDGVGTLLAIQPVHAGAAETDWRVRIAIPPEWARYTVAKGSITVEGISLTVAAIAATAEDTVVEIAIIPHTYKATNLHTLEPGSPVNIEADVLAKYAEKLAASEANPFALTVEYLIANGY